jgi:hypothetical protein
MAQRAGAGVTLRAAGDVTVNSPSSDQRTTRAFLTMMEPFIDE